MSVAFRRESDEEHKEPRFELPIPPGPNLVTRRGLAQIEERVAALEAVETEGREPAEIEQSRRSLRYWRTRLATAQLAGIMAASTCQASAKTLTMRRPCFVTLAEAITSRGPAERR